ncbi:hypothetical protein BDZ90DRAFT_229084 [Jaminaea rosea]|uniref:Uncharacterized protein n=1 Tax=Jaminaea rosea TaxID=1569628 RepID=A0A316V0G9_9BASI|nr:hypothetical protein BDZ90DRAFT_229084 [Jaminaea rosea]PWN30051.1 hypothetical protein BDZ90DRAFT_229084 [Jaminaea rosea]
MMNCLSWWLPLFLIAKPACPPELLVLLVVIYFIKTRPCFYCTAIVIGLFLATSYWDQLQPWKPTADASRLLRVNLPGTKTGFDLDLGWSWR